MLMKLSILPLLCLMIITSSTITEAAETKAVYAYEDGLISGSEITFDYKPESLYEVNCKPGHITDITLKPGEEVTHIVAGDTAQWLIDQSKVNKTTHIYVKPVKGDITTNLIINSAIHSYRLILNSTDNYNAIVSWNFSEEDKLVRESNILRAQSLSVPEKHKLNFNYEISPKKSSLAYLTPVAVFDDGTHTYIKMPTAGRYELPVLYLVDETNKMSIINYRVKKNLFIADRIFNHGRLLFSKNLTLDFYTKPKKAGA